MTDRVGPENRPTYVKYLYTKQYYSFIARMYGNFYPLSTVMKHETTIVNNTASNIVTVVSP